MVDNGIKPIFRVCDYYKATPIAEGHPVRKTKYAQELCEPGIRRFPSGNEAPIEKLHIKESGEEEIRFSWWKDGKIMPRPLDLSEDDLIALFRDAVAKDVFTPAFRLTLRSIL
jgi:hypothetical protein